MLQYDFLNVILYYVPYVNILCMLIISMINFNLCR